MGCFNKNDSRFSALQAFLALLFLLLIAAPALALGVDLDGTAKPSLWGRLSSKAGGAFSQGRKMLHCCGASNHEPWDFPWLPYCWQGCNGQKHCRSGNTVWTCSPSK